MDIEGLSDENLKHLAILADTVILSADLVTVALRELITRNKIDESIADAYVAKVNQFTKA